jgi:hypothetical protein
LREAEFLHHRVDLETCHPTLTRSGNVAACPGHLHPADAVSGPMGGAGRSHVRDLAVVGCVAAMGGLADRSVSVGLYLAPYPALSGPIRRPWPPARRPP